MKEINQNEMSDVNPDNNFDTLCQQFDNGSFYGLEYILEDFFQNTAVKPSFPVQHSVDWFGLNS